jgi:MFS family permease
MLSGPFVRAAVTNFFFFSSASSFNLLPLYIKQLGGTEAEIGLIMGMHNVAAILCQPLLGEWVDRLGRRPFMLFGVGLAVLTSLVFVFTSSLSPLFWLLRFLQGIAFSAFFVANYSLVIGLVPAERRGWALGIFGISGLLSNALAPLLGEQMIRRFGYRAFFLEASALAFLPLALVWRVREPQVAPGIRTQGLKALAEGLGEVFRLHMAIAFFFGLGTGTIITFVPTLAESLGVMNLSLFYTAYAGCALVVRVIGGGLIDRLGRRAIIVPSMFVQTVGSAVLAILGFLVGAHPTIPALPLLFLAGLLTGGAHGFLFPALTALLMDQTSEGQRARVVAIYSSVFLTGGALGAAIFGYVAREAGYGVMFGALTASLAAGFAISVRLP